jgi:hypothetical protein
MAATSVFMRAEIEKNIWAECHQVMTSCMKVSYKCLAFHLIDSGLTAVFMSMAAVM